ncbi:uncharacterized protein [Chironomus tepperi]|uniref:uncharacterized protein n=1 Tax=Chironomus tepperi TaxID=113505 RepID=UPI00391F14D5
MGIIQLNSFLCFNLEVGGKFISWLGMLRYELNMIILLVLMCIIGFFPCEDIAEQVNKIALASKFLNSCSIAKAFLLWVIITILAFNLAMFYIYYALYEGILKNCARQIVPGIIFEFISLFLGLLMFIAYSWSIVPMTVMVVIQVYFIWTLLSIYRKIEKGTTASITYVPKDTTSRIVLKV